ncbi:hypothetical protein KI387_044347, partial [Taxus chinensis]
MVGVIEGLSKEYWGKMGDVAMGKDIGIGEEDVKVGVSGFITMTDIGVVGIDKALGIIRIFGDVNDVVMGMFDIDVVKGLNMIGWGTIDVDEVVYIVKVDVDVVKVVGMEKSMEGGTRIDSKDGIMGKGGMDVGKVVKSNDESVLTNGVDMIGNAINVGVTLGVEVGGNACLINVSRGKNDMLVNGVDFVGVDVCICLFDVDVGEGTK